MSIVTDIVLDKAREVQDQTTKKDVLLRFKSGDDISVSLIQRKCTCGYFTATRVFEKMVKDGIVKRAENTNGISKYI